MIYVLIFGFVMAALLLLEDWCFKCNVYCCKEHKKGIYSDGDITG